MGEKNIIEFENMIPNGVLDNIGSGITARQTIFFRSLGNDVKLELSILRFPKGDLFTAQSANDNNARYRITIEKIEHE
ncbi:hypothetical protein [Pedobacter sp. Leaf250]|uniref:hypothetical protein n=1 Tax=Pedobacter sp. Leaf250 TaxID=2876559 RepID=UPI001E31BDC0|nr:hypothetical protein [Pedobacter sp. Leaf250]